MFKKYTSEDSWLVGVLALVAFTASSYFYLLGGSVAVNLGLVEPTAAGQVAQTVSSSNETYYFNIATGADTNSCSQGAPCKTVAKAISIAESRQNSTGDTTLLFAAGDYGALDWNIPGNFASNVLWQSQDTNNPARLHNLYVFCDGCISNQTFDSFNIYRPSGGGSRAYVVEIRGIAYLTISNNEVHNEDLYAGFGGIKMEARTDTNGTTHMSHHNNFIGNEIHDMIVGISYKSHDTVIRGNELYRIPGSLIGMSCGGNLHADRVQSAWNMLIEDNVLHDNLGDYPNEPGYEGYDEPHELHSSTFSIRGSDTTIRGNRAWNTNKVWIQFYRGDCGISNYDVENIVIEENIFYGSGRRGVLQTYNNVVTGPITIRNNTVTDMFFLLNLKGDVFSGEGVEVYDNFFSNLGIPYNAHYEAYTAPTAAWKMDHNVAFNKAWIAREIDPTNLILGEGAANTLFTNPDYSEYTSLDCGPEGRDSCDWTPAPGSILCTAGRNGGHVGAVPCRSANEQRS